MPDFGFYWKNFAKDSDWPCARYFSGAERVVGKISRQDHVWLFASGDTCGMSEGNSGYLVQVFVVGSVGPNPGDNPEYRVETFPQSIDADPNRCVAVDPPLLVDEIVRGTQGDRHLHIGRVRQKPWRLSEDMVGKLRQLLNNERRDQFVHVFTAKD